MELEGWEEKDNHLVKVFEFDNFVEAVDFVNKVVPFAEEAAHHPDLEVFSYNKVKISLTTHDKGKITQKDYDLAEKIEDVA